MLLHVRRVSGAFSDGGALSAALLGEKDSGKCPVFEPHRLDKVLIDFGILLPLAVLVRLFFAAQFCRALFCAWPRQIN